MEIRLQKAANGKGCEEVERSSVGYFPNSLTGRKKWEKEKGRSWGLVWKKGSFQDVKENLSRKLLL